MASAVGTRADCPTWCARHHDITHIEGLCHISGALQVKHTLLRLVTKDEGSLASVDDTYLMFGDELYTLYEGEVLLAAITDLLDRAADDDKSPELAMVKPAAAPDTPG